MNFANFMEEVRDVNFIYVKTQQWVYFTALLMVEVEDVRKKDVAFQHEALIISALPMEVVTDALTVSIGLTQDLDVLNTTVIVLHVSNRYFPMMKGH